VSSVCIYVLYKDETGFKVIRVVDMRIWGVDSTIIYTTIVVQIRDGGASSFLKMSFCALASDSQGIKRPPVGCQSGLRRFMPKGSTTSAAGILSPIAQ
jgi:hypothetical protein